MILKCILNKRQRSAQTIIEYLVLMVAVVSIAIVFLGSDIGRLQGIGGMYFNKVSRSILGNPPSCGDGYCSEFEDLELCCVDCGGCVGHNI